VSLLRGDHTTWRTVAGVLCAEASRGLAIETQLRMRAEQAILDEKRRFQEMEHLFKNEETKVKLKEVENRLSLEIHQKEYLEKSKAT
jgi:hypothetical protein